MDEELAELERVVEEGNRLLGLPSIAELASRKPPGIR
jgi:hypothetical protein